MGPLWPGEALPVRPRHSFLDLGCPSATWSGSPVRPGLRNLQAPQPVNPTTRRRVFQVILALAIIALVVAQGLWEASNGFTPNH